MSSDKSTSANTKLMIAQYERIVARSEAERLRHALERIATGRYPRYREIAREALAANRSSCIGLRPVPSQPSPNTGTPGSTKN